MVAPRHKKLNKNNKDKRVLRCGFCGRRGHNSLNCWQRPKSAIRKTERRIKPQSEKTRIAEGKLRYEWYQTNSPDKDGYYECWLQISTLCPKKMVQEFMYLEHIYPRRKYPELKFVPLNIKPACSFCNKLKGSQTPQQLAKIFPRIATLLKTKEWQELSVSLLEYCPRLKLALENS